MQGVNIFGNQEHLVIVLESRDVLEMEFCFFTCRHLHNLLLLVFMIINLESEEDILARGGHFWKVTTFLESEDVFAKKGLLAK